jgi:hypothetical protein
MEVRKGYGCGESCRSSRPICRPSADIKVVASTSSRTSKALEGVVQRFLDINADLPDSSSGAMSSPRRSAASPVPYSAFQIPPSEGSDCAAYDRTNDLEGLDYTSTKIPAFSETTLHKGSLDQRSHGCPHRPYSRTVAHYASEAYLSTVQDPTTTYTHIIPTTQTA